jgi:putative oxidoreductase
VFAEVVCAFFITIGLFSRAAAIPLIFTMAVAAFLVHGSDPFSGKELALSYLAAYAAILVAGPGKFSIDQSLK